MKNLDQRQWADMILKLGKRRINKMGDASFEYKGFDIVLKEGLITDTGDVSYHFEFVDYPNKTELLTAVKGFIDSAVPIQ